MPPLNDPDGVILPHRSLNTSDAGALSMRPAIAGETGGIDASEHVKPDAVARAFSNLQVGNPGAAEMAREGSDAIIVTEISEPGAGLSQKDFFIRCGGASQCLIAMRKPSKTLNHFAMSDGVRVVVVAIDGAT